MIYVSEVTPPNIDVSVRRTALASANRNRIAAIPVCLRQSLTRFLDAWWSIGWRSTSRRTKASAQLEARTAAGGVPSRRRFDLVGELTVVRSRSGSR